MLHKIPFSGVVGKRKGQEIGTFHCKGTKEGRKTGITITIYPIPFTEYGELRNIKSYFSHI